MSQHDDRPGGAWCSPHQCHPSDCFNIHNPILDTLPAVEVDYGQKKHLWDHDPTKILSKDEVRRLSGLTFHNISLVDDDTNPILKVSVKDDKGNVFNVPFDVFNLKSEVMGYYRYFELPIKTLVAFDTSWSNRFFQKMMLNKWGFDTTRRVTTYEDIERGVLVIKQEVNVDRSNGASSRSDQTPLKRKDSVGWRRIREIGYRAGLLRRERGTS